MTRNIGALDSVPPAVQTGTSSDPQTWKEVDWPALTLSDEPDTGVRER